jgi:proteasome lid subunit RPN8/RPN11
MAGLIDQAAIAAIRDHAESEWPRECCGVLLRTGAYLPLTNVHRSPRKAFRLPPVGAEYVAVGAVAALVHSHTLPGCDHPSAADLEDQVRCGPPVWGLVVVRDRRAADPFFWGPGIDAPYDRRPFRWGPTGTDGKGDCWALMRDWYRRERGLILPEVPRDSHWERDSPELYEEGWRRTGFREIPVDELQEGDAVLMRINSRQRGANHGGIYLGGDSILQHRANLLSGVEGASRWVAHATRTLRPPGVPTWS